MYASDKLTDAGHRWRSAAEALLSESEQIGPLDEGVFGELGTDEEGEAAAQRLDEQVDVLLKAGDDVFNELLVPASDSSDARYQATSLLVGTLAVGDAMAIARRSPSNVFGELSVATVQTATFADVRTILAEADTLVTVPASLDESLDKIQEAGATESWKVLAGGTGKLAGGALVSGLEGVLSGAAAAAFDAIRRKLSSWRDALVRGAIRIAKWVVGRLRALMPAELADKFDSLLKAIQKKIDDADVSEIAIDLYGRLLGRNDTVKAWETAAGEGKDLSIAASKLPGIAASKTGRVAWVTRGRKLIEEYDSVVAGAIGVSPNVQLAFAALVAAVLGFITLQVWDAFKDIEALV